MGQPETRYATSGDVSIAYQVVGEGPVDLVFFPGWFSHMDLQWEIPQIASWLRRLASFSRLILFDKRGVGLSDPTSSAPTLDERMADVQAVMDAAGSEQAAIFGLSEGGTMSALFAAAHPHRVRALVLYGTWAAGPSVLAEHRLPGWQQGQRVRLLAGQAMERWGSGELVASMAPSIRDLPASREAMARFERAALSRAMARDLWLAIDRSDARAALPLIAAPTLVLHRSGDIIPVEQARYLAEQIPGARLVELPGPDHLPWVGDARAVADEVESFLTGARPAPPVERVLATVLFTDIVGSTATATRVGDREWRRLLDAHDGLVRQELAQHGGTAAKQLGDGFLAAFDGPARAVSCARAIRDGMGSLGLEVRAGLHAGECERLSDDVRGIAVHIAARVTELAGPGEVLVSRTVRDLLFGSDYAFAPRGRHALKGVPEEWELYSLASAQPAAD